MLILLTVRGSQGHAGTVPISMRQDPMVAAAELIVSLESLCKRPQDYISSNGPDGQCNAFSIKSLSGSLVCTVGEISTWPSASNVIPGQVTFTIDIRTIDDIGREAIIYELSNQMDTICDRRSVSCIMERKGSVDPFSLVADELSIVANRLRAMVVAEVPKLVSAAEYFFKMGVEGKRFRPTIVFAP